VAVDEQGDVIQWGRAYSRTYVPEPTLKGKNIIRVAIRCVHLILANASGDNVVCLAKSGKVYILPASKSELLSGPKPTETTWIPFWSSTANVSYIPLSVPEKVASIAAGDDHFLVLSQSGRVYSAATTSDGNTFGQLGVETNPEADLLQPYPIKSFDNDKVREIAAGERHSLALTSHGEVYSWGSNAQGQLLQQFARNRYTETTPTIVPIHKLIPGSRSVLSIAAGGANSFLVVSVNGDIELYASGSGMWGQLGSGMWNQIQHRPARVKTIRGLAEWSESLGRKVNIGIRYISVGQNHVAAVLDNDVSSGIGGRDVFIWGCGEAYQLGHGKVPLLRGKLTIAQ
jgi:alpha-tubulin suppressor-like RCC1 family protein